MLPSKGVSATLGIIGPVQRAELQLNEYARSVARSLFNIAQFPKTASCFFLFSTESFSVHQNPEIYLQKKDRAAFAGGPSQGGNALGGQQQRGAIADLVLQIKKPRALTGLNLCSRFFC